jgi:hypothetical protein
LPTKSGVEFEGAGATTATVEAMYRANWPARRRPTEGERATLERVATRRLEGDGAPREEAIASPRAPKVWGESESEDKAAEARQQAAPKDRTTCGLEGAPPREERVASPTKSGVRFEGAGDVTTHCKDTCPHHIQLQGTTQMGTHSPCNAIPQAAQ